MEKQIVNNFYGIVNGVRFDNSEIYTTVVYVLSELEKHFKVDITDTFITNILTGVFYYEYKGANLLEVADTVIQYICEEYKTVDDFIDDMKVISNPQEFIRFTYNQLRSTEVRFKEICRTMQNKWEDIRREVLLEWSNGSDNSPFTLDELETVSRLTKDPIAVIDVLGGKFTVNLYDKIEYESLN